MILPVDPASPWWARDAASTILFLHIGGGTVGMFSGAAALLTRKGGRLHRVAGNIFFISMLVMSVIGASVAPFLSDRVSTVAGFMTFYLVATAWMAVMRKEGVVGRFEFAGLFVALAVAAAGMVFIRMAANSATGTVDGAPPQAFYVFVLVGAIAAASDLNVILRGGLSGAARIARHLWRMCTALTIATGSFFLGQQKFLPASLHNSPILFLPVFTPLLLMFFWLIRVRLANIFKQRAAAA